MITVHWYDKEYTSEKAVKYPDRILLCDESNAVLQEICNLSGKDWVHISIEGEWSYPEDIPTENEVLRADLDFVTMENEYLTEQNEQQQADIDYCLMLLEE